MSTTSTTSTTTVTLPHAQRALFLRRLHALLEQAAARAGTAWGRVETLAGADVHPRPLVPVTAAPLGGQ